MYIPSAWCVRWGQGSGDPPALVHWLYTPQPETGPPLALSPLHTTHQSLSHKDQHTTPTTCILLDQPPTFLRPTTYILRPTTYILTNHLITNHHQLFQRPTPAYCLTILMFVVELSHPGDGERNLSPHLLHSEPTEASQDKGVAGHRVSPGRHLLHTGCCAHSLQLGGGDSPRLPGAQFA